MCGNFGKRYNGIDDGHTFKETGHISRRNDKQSAVFRNDFFQFHDGRNSHYRIAEVVGHPYGNAVAPLSDLRDPELRQIAGMYNILNKCTFNHNDYKITSKQAFFKKKVEKMQKILCFT